MNKPRSRGRNTAHALATLSHADAWPRSVRFKRMHGEAGFTLIELLVAIVILAGGLLAIATLQFTASGVTRDTKAREGATNLAREVVETIVNTSYAGVEPSTVDAVVAAKPALAPQPGYPGWTILRRDIPYRLSVSGCYVDDPGDGRGDHDGPFCDSSGGSSDDDPVDYKRFGVAVSWTSRGTQRSVTQTTLLVPKGQAKVPSVTSLTSGQGITVTDPSVTSVAFTATTSSRAAGLAWSLNGGIRGLASGNNTSWGFTWSISGLPDGQYVVGAQAYNDAGTYGKPSSLTITLNRSAPSTPLEFVAGWNATSGKVDTEWLASSDQDTVGYTVYRRQTAPTTGATTKVNCGTVASPVYVVTDTECTDASPILPPTGGGAPAFRGASSANGGGKVASTTVPKPAGVVAGDVMVATLNIQGRPGVTTPAGWTLIADTRTGKTEQASWYRVAGSSEPASYTFSVAGSTWWQTAGITAYSGVDTTNPIDVFGATIGSGTSAVSPNLTTNYDNAAVLNPVHYFVSSKTPATTPDPSLTERYDIGSGDFITSESADAVQATAGPTGAKTAVHANPNTGWASQLIVLKPSGSGSASIAVNYWVVALDRTALGALREGPPSNVVNAYAPNQPPLAVTGSLTCTSNSDGSNTLTWTQPAQPGDPDSGDRISFDRIYRDDARYDRTGLGTENTYTDPNPGGTRDYHITTVDTHLAESAPSPTVSC